MISVLCPTRLRHEALRRSLASLDDTARDGELEILLAVDPDDPTDYDGLGTVVTMPERCGYARLHCYYNVLAVLAHGDWLLLWNDDAVMSTEGWNAIVEAHEPSVVVSPWTVHHPLCTFPIVPRRFAEALGHFSLNAHCDSWWEQIARQLGILAWPDIWVDHDRADITGANRDTVFAERQYQTADFMSPEMMVARERDADVIRGLLGG